MASLVFCGVSLWFYCVLLVIDRMRQPKYGAPYSAGTMLVDDDGKPILGTWAPCDMSLSRWFNG